MPFNNWKYNAFVVTSEGEYAIIKPNNFDMEYLGGEGMQFGEAINTGTESNHIRADCVGNTFMLNVNGVLLLETQDDELLQGEVGLVVGTTGVGGVDILFDNFTLIEP